MTARPGQVALLAALASALITAYLVVNPGPVPFVAGSGSRVQQAIDRMTIDRKAEQSVEHLQPLLPSLGKPSANDAEPVNLALLGYREIVPPPAPTPEPAAPSTPEPVEYKVSMTYVSANRRFAVIDGHFYREGARLPDGARVVAISPRAVRIEREGRARNLEIEKDRDALSGKDNVIRTDAGTVDKGAPIASSNNQTSRS